MKRSELIKLLEDLASKDLSEGAAIYDHPCIVAAREINRLDAGLFEAHRRLIKSSEEYDAGCMEISKLLHPAI